MIKSTLPYNEDRSKIKLARRNKVGIHTTYSTDGRYTESVYIDYDNSDNFALFVFESMLNTSAMVNSYSVYDELGARITAFDQARFPKRV